MAYPQDSRPTLQVLLGSSPQLVSSLYRYVPAVLFGYFSLIVLANSLQLTWLAYWLEIWSGPVSAMRGILPIFDNLGGQLDVMGRAQRAAIVHHLLFAGWSIFLVAFIFCTAAVLRILPAEWMKIARAYSAWKFAMWSVMGLLFSIFGFFCISIGIKPTGNVLWDWNRYDPQLLWIAGAFYMTLFFWIGALTMAIAAGVAYEAWRGTTTKKPDDPTTVD